MNTNDKRDFYLEIALLCCNLDSLNSKTHQRCPLSWSQVIQQTLLRTSTNISAISRWKVLLLGVISISATSSTVPKQNNHQALQIDTLRVQTLKHQASFEMNPADQIRLALPASCYYRSRNYPNELLNVICCAGFYSDYSPETLARFFQSRDLAEWYLHGVTSNEIVGISWSLKQDEHHVYRFWRKELDLSNDRSRINQTMQPLRAAGLQHADLHNKDPHTGSWYYNPSLNWKFVWLTQKLDISRSRPTNRSSSKEGTFGLNGVVSLELILSILYMRAFPWSFLIMNMKLPGKCSCVFHSFESLTLDWQARHASLVSCLSLFCIFKLMWAGSVFMGTKMMYFP